MDQQLQLSNFTENLIGIEGIPQAVTYVIN
jgi:hypothetical protein